MARQELDILLETFSTGKFSNKIILVIGAYWFLNGMEVAVITLILPRLHCIWNLSSTQSALLASPFFFGMALGSLFWGWLGDRYGRKYLIVCSACVVFYFELLTPASFALQWFMIMQSFVGFGTAGVIITGAYMVEFVGTQWRAKSIFLNNAFYVFGNLFVAALGYFVMNSYGWKKFILAKAAPIPFIILLLLWLPESVRYLQNNGKFDQIVKILHYISIQNKKPMPQDISLEKRNTSLQGQVSVLFSKQYRRPTLLLIPIWLTVVVNYYSIVLFNTSYIQYREYNATHPACSKLKNRDYFQNTLVVLGELVAIFVSLTFIEKVRRQAILVVAGLLNSICLIVIAASPGFYVYTIFISLARGLAALTVQATWLYTAEIYPTFIRATGIGIPHGAANFALIVTPFMVQTVLYYSLHLFIATLVVFYLIMITLVLQMKETKGVPIA